MFSVRNVEKFLREQDFSEADKKMILRQAIAKSEKGILSGFHAYELFGQKQGTTFLREIAKNHQHIIIGCHDIMAANCPLE